MEENISGAELHVPEHGQSAKIYFVTSLDFMLL